MKYLTVVFVSVFLAAITAFGVSLVEPERAEAATVGVRGCTGTIVQLTAAEKQMLGLHNQTRANRGLPRLCVHPALQRAARWYSKDMIERDYFNVNHTTKGGETFEQRMKRFGYRNYSLAGENIAYGSGAYGSPNNRFNAWMKSSGHKSNILNRKFREIGIGAVTGTYKGTRNVTMWTADFGSR